MKDGEAARTEAIAFHRVVSASGHYKPEFHPRKKTKAMQDTLHGKRNLDMAVARGCHHHMRTCTRRLMGEG